MLCPDFTDWAGQEPRDYTESTGAEWSRDLSLTSNKYGIHWEKDGWVLIHQPYY